jgi:primary-amine oxidase
MMAERLPWMPFLSGVAFAILTFLLIVPFQDRQHDWQERIGTLSNRVTFHAPKVNIFADLTAEERGAVTTFIYHQNGPNLTIGDSYGGWIDQLEVLRPNKSDALNYFDNEEQRPARYARVSTVQYDPDAAKIVDYMVGPLPVSSATTMEPLFWPYNSGRNWVTTLLPNPLLLFSLIGSIGEEMQDITRDLLGAKINLDDPLDPNSLAAGARPISFEEPMAIWLEVFRPGTRSNSISLLPQGLYLKMNMKSYHPKDWTTSAMYYNGILYPNITAFRSALKSPDFVKLSQNTDGSWTENEDYDANPSERDQPPPLSIQPFGPRYQLDKKQKYVSWMGFTFYFSTSQSTGLSLFDISFEGHRIIYSLGLQEAMAHYAGSEPMQSGLEFLDTFFGMGNMMFSLVPGYDCPAHASYVDMTYHKVNETFTNKNAICIFEYTSDAPLQRHTSEFSVTVSRNTYLVVRSVSTVGNYDYTIDYLFYLDGSIEVKVRASGYIFTSFAGHPRSTTSDTKDNDADELRSRSSPPFPHPNHRYGYQIQPSASTSMHDHTLLFRADLDISPSGLNDSFQRVSIKPFTHAYPWDTNPNHKDPSHPQPRNTMRLAHHPLTHETGLNWPKNAAEMYLIQSPELNAWAENKAYRILPGTGMGTPSHLSILNSTSLGKSAKWSESDLWVVKNKESEAQGASYLNYLCPNDPLVDFAKISDGEALNVKGGKEEEDESKSYSENEADGDDLVVYFNLGTHHVPGSSDIPNTLMHTSASSVMFIPFNYFDEDVSKYRRQGVRVDAQTRADLGWKEGMRVVGGGRYEDAGTKGKRKHVVLDVRRDLEPEVDGFFEEGGMRAVGKRVGGGIWGLWKGH